ncbi:hypothetical protein [Zestomonas carbonaria]|uniref:3-isopropylmalate dehydratase n=1 Tax=Zestomonas carbonaria TaxID=2762745 RepID=A0A7U7ELJ9_9GAMM|nr:hypothetical protein [Pseudomonas carbonaria]CAD5107258.1 hypothetical protein PSEWESI4_01529 [Pseudomonas carbonaria]
MRRPILSFLLLLPLVAQAAPYGASTAPAQGYGVLIVSRERLEVASPCDIGLYLHDQLAARLYQGQSVAFNLPPGDVPLRLALIGPGNCAPGIVQADNQPVRLQAGQVRKFRIALDDKGFQLIPAPLDR